MTPNIDSEMRCALDPRSIENMVVQNQLYFRKLWSFSNDRYVNLSLPEIRVTSEEMNVVNRPELFDRVYALMRRILKVYHVI